MQPRKEDPKRPVEAECDRCTARYFRWFVLWFVRILTTVDSMNSRGHGWGSVPFVIMNIWGISKANWGHRRGRPQARDAHGPENAPSLAAFRRKSWIGTSTSLVLDGHCVRVNGLLAGNAFKSCDDAAIIVFVALHRKAPFTSPAAHVKPT